MATHYFCMLNFRYRSAPVMPDSKGNSANETSTNACRRTVVVPVKTVAFASTVFHGTTATVRALGTADCCAKSISTNATTNRRHAVPAPARTCPVRTGARAETPENAASTALWTIRV